jgi:hypothetical protein
MSFLCDGDEAAPGGASAGVARSCHHNKKTDTQSRIPPH